MKYVAALARSAHRPVAYRREPRARAWNFLSGAIILLYSSARSCFMPASISNDSAHDLVLAILLLPRRTCGRPYLAGPGSIIGCCARSAARATRSSAASASCLARSWSPPSISRLWETFARFCCSTTVYVLKRELMWLPIFGWWVAKAEMIPIRRGAGGTALAEIAERAKVEIAREADPLVPGGTRRAPGAEPAYKYGVVRLYAELGVRCLPVALNSGVFWPRRKLVIYPARSAWRFFRRSSPGSRRNVFCGAHAGRDETATARLGGPRPGRAGSGAGAGGRKSCLTETSFVLSLFLSSAIRFW